MHFSTFDVYLQLDLERPLEEQGHIDVFIHKLTDIIAAADQGDSKVRSLLLSISVLSLGKGLPYILRTLMLQKCM